MRIIVAVTGASGVEMSYDLVCALKGLNCEVYLIISEGAKTTWKLEAKQSMKALRSLADKVYEEDDLGADIASGSFVTDGMIIMPCSIKTLAGIVTGYAENLIIRSADVCMKENRKLVLVPREMPLSRLHLRNLKDAADLGCIIVPPLLTFYNEPMTMDDQINHVIGKILLQFGMEYSKFKAWKGR